MVTLMIFEDDEERHLRPVSLIVPCCEIQCGSSSIRGSIKRLMDICDIKIETYALMVRNELALLTDISFDRNEYLINPREIDDDVLLVNSRLVPSLNLTEIVTKMAKGAYCAIVEYSTSKLLLALAPRHLVKKLEPLTLNKIAEIRRLLPYVYVTGLFILRELSDLVTLPLRNIRYEIDTVVRMNPSNYVKKRKRVFISKDAFLEPHVIIDDTMGPVLIDGGVYIESGSVLKGPCIISKGAYVRRSMVTNSIIGPFSTISGVVKHSVISNNVFIGGFSFISCSYVGSYSIIGHKTIVLSKSKAFRVSLSSNENTFVKPTGAIVSPFAIVSSGSIIYPNTVVPPLSKIAFTPFGKESDIRGTKLLNDIRKNLSRISSIIVSLKELRKALDRKTSIP